jgi:flagellar hook-basal body complex protein FliE
MADMRIHGNMEPLGSALNVKSPVGKNDGGSFASTLSEALGEVNELQLNADKAIEDLVTGKSKNIHETMIALSKAELAFKLTMQVRSKVMEAYKEITSTAV